VAPNHPRSEEGGPGRPPPPGSPDRCFPWGGEPTPPQPATARSERFLVLDSEGSRQWRSLRRRGSLRPTSAPRCAGDLRPRAYTGQEPSPCSGCLGGAHGVSLPSSQIQRWRRRQRDPSLGEESEEEVVLEEVDEVPWVSRRPHLKGVAGIKASSPSAGILASVQRSAVK
jgi:hypothetical protein